MSRAQATRLGSGLAVVTDPMPHLETAAVAIQVRAGSRFERADEHGIAHLLEHMVFKGTKRRDARRIVEEIEAVGGDLDAATSVETASYHARVLKEDVPLALDILADMVRDSVFDARELAREQQVIVQEIGGCLDDPEERASDLVQEAAFPGQSIGRAILGTVESVTGFTPNDLRAFLARRYRAPAMVVAAAGAVEHARVVEAAERLFAGLETAAPESAASARFIGGDRREIRDLEQVQVVLGLQGRSYRDADVYVAQTLAHVLGGGMSSRLFQELREKRGLCYSVCAYHLALDDSGLLGFAAATGEETAPELMQVLCDEITAAAESIDDAEIARARAQLKAGQLMSLESPAARAGQIGKQMLAFGRVVPVEEIVAKLEAVTAERVRGLLADTLAHSFPALAVVGPAGGLEDLDRVAGRLGARTAPQAA